MRENERLRKARKDRRWSIEKTAEKIGISRTTYLRWEHGEQGPHDSTVLLACEAFNMSPEQLGFSAPISTSLTETLTTQTTIINNQAPSSNVDMLTVSALGLRLIQHQHGWTPEELRFRTEQELRRLDGMTEQNGNTVSRRDTLKFIISLPVAFLGLTQGNSTTEIPTEEAIPLYVTSVPACWRLYFDGELTEVERVLPTYVSQLTIMSQQVSRYQKTAASLLSQAHQLMAEVVMQKEDFGTSLTHCKQALLYAELANDYDVQVASLIRKSNTLWYRQRSTLQTNQEAMEYTHKISPLLQSRIYSEYGANLATRGQEQEALRHMGLANDTFPDKPEDDPAFLYTHTTKYVIYLNAMISYLKLNQPTEAWNAIREAELYVPEKVSPRRMELLKHMVIASIATNDLEQSKHHFELMEVAASRLGSDLWINDISTTYGQMLIKWPRETQIKSIAERLQV